MSVAYSVDENGFDYATITESWAMPSEYDDGSELDAVDVIVEWSKDGGTWETAATVPADAGTAVLDRVPLPAVVNVRLRTRALNGALSDPTTPVEYELETDTTPPPVPATPTVSSRLGVLTVAWDGTFVAGTKPSDFDRVEVHGAGASGFTPLSSTLVGTLTERGYSSFTGMPYNVPLYFVLVAVDKRGNRSAKSVETTGTAIPVVAADVGPGQITATEIADDAITTPKLAAGAVTANELAANSVVAGKIATNAITAAKVDAGAITGVKLSADAIDGKVITGATLRTAASGQRVEINEDGLQMIGPDGVVVVDMDADTGAASFSGRFQTGADDEYPRSIFLTSTRTWVGAMDA